LGGKWVSLHFLFFIFVNRRVFFQSLHEMLDNPHVSVSSKIRLVMLYALRYEERGNPELLAFTDKLHRAGATAPQVRVGSRFLIRCCVVRVHMELVSELTFLSFISLLFWGRLEHSRFASVCWSSKTRKRSFLEQEFACLVEKICAT
jgi:hypothetical protein